LGKKGKIRITYGFHVRIRLFAKKKKVPVTASLCVPRGKKKYWAVPTVAGLHKRKRGGSDPKKEEGRNRRPMAVDPVILPKTPSSPSGGEKKKKRNESELICTRFARQTFRVRQS